MSRAKPSFFKRLRRLILRPLARRPHATKALYDELLYLSSRTQSLEELLTIVPERISDALGLSHFHLLLREKTSYTLQPQPLNELGAIAFPASCSTVSRMKRDHRPALFVSAGQPHAQPDGWQLLATPSEIEALANLHAQVLLPLAGRADLVGFATLGRASGVAFTTAELRFLRDVGPEIGRGFETAQLIHSISVQAVERARAHRELEVARQVQERLLPAKLPEVPGLDAAVFYRSAAQIGGDYYDFFRAGSGEFAIVIADVAGKGVPAALLMASLGATVHALMLLPDTTITSRVEHLNRLLYEVSSASHYATLFHCLYDPNFRTLTYINAGHNPPYLLRADGSVERLTCGGSVVGLLPGATYENGSLLLGPGDLLLAYTDGITEATDLRGNEWGEDSLEHALLASGTGHDRPARTIIDEVLAKVSSFTAGAAQGDDMTLLVLRASGPASPGR